ncbi:membrane protein insertion efficiency factor YidD [Nocardioides sp.]|uniref:membrane protein insertion efficiency factor YidD n=1 Tax=Nocardioides sp. TaxID=35761 RepID=UPI00351546F1
MKWVLVALVRAYQLVVSPFLGQTCRYYPSCSSYAVTALERHGALRGGWLALRRLLRCHPWSPGGVDHVPESTSRRRRAEAPAPAAVVSDPAPSPDTRAAAAGGPPSQQGV